MREVRQLILDWLLMCVIVSVILATAFGVSTIYGADHDADYWQAKAAAAIAISSPLASQEETPDARPTQPKPKAERLIVTMYSASWCAPCQQAKAELKAAKDLPFDLRIIDVSNGGQPAWCNTIPAFSWPKESGGVWHCQWAGVADLVGRWKRSQERDDKANHKAPQARSPPVNQYPPMHGYRPRWTWPGDLRQHLRAEHGITEPLTQDQAEALHDALHEGYSIQQIRRAIR